MAYRRKPGGNPKPLVLEGDLPRSAPEELPEESSLAARAIRASSAARRESSLSSAYGESALSSPPPAVTDASSHRVSPGRGMRSPPTQDSNAFEYASMKNLHESKYGFWGVLADKAKRFLDEEREVFRRQENLNRNQASTPHIPTDEQFPQSNLSSDSHQKNGSPKIKKGLGAISSSFNYIGGKVGNALEETRKLNIRRKGTASNLQNQAGDTSRLFNTHNQMDLEIQVKAARDVANAMAAKAKLLMRELKTVKADLAFAKERCAQLEEENKILRESNERGDNAEDDDLIRLQLETLLAEKARLSQENSVYARENRFLREIVEYHRLTMQDVVYLDEGAEEVSEVYTIPSPTMSPHGSVCVSPTTNPNSWTRTFSAPAAMAGSRNFSSQTSISRGASPVYPTTPQNVFSDDLSSNTDAFPL